MVINVSGTSGSGKSTLVRRLMAACSSVTPQHEPGRRQPIGYLCESGDVRLWVVGHYEVACGGGDTIHGLDALFAEVDRRAAESHHVIFESLMASQDTKRLVNLHRAHRVVAVALNTPFDVCMAGIRERRAERGNLDPVDPKWTRKKFDDTQRQRSILRDANVDYRSLSRDAAFDAICELLRVHMPVAA